MEYMIQNFKHVVFEKYATFEGRASRREFWYFVLASFLISAILGFVEGLVFGATATPRLTQNGGALGNIYSLLVFVPSLAVAARRLHDIDKSGWWMLVPFYNIYLFFQRGHEGANRFDTTITSAAATPAPVAMTAEPVAPPVVEANVVPEATEASKNSTY